MTRVTVVRLGTVIREFESTGDLVPSPGDNDKWGIRSQEDGMDVYSPDFTFAQVSIIAWAHNVLGLETFEEVASVFPAVLDTEGEHHENV